MAGWVVRVLLIALVVRVLVGLVTSALRRRGASEPTSRPGGKPTALVRDPVCGTYVEPSHAISTRAGSTVHYFCSENCREAFGRS